MRKSVKNIVYGSVIGAFVASMIASVVMHRSISGVVKGIKIDIEDEDV